MKTIQKTDVYQMVTNLIIEKMEQGIIPWRKPWTSYGMAANYVTKAPYRGINALLLNTLPYEKPFFLTFKQAKNLGGHIKKGEKAMPVTYSNTLYKDLDTKKNLSSEQASLLPKERVKVFFFIQYHNVFNIDQVEGVDFNFPEIITRPENERIDCCEKVIQKMPNPPEIIYREMSAYYQPSEDYINMPKLEFFESTEDFYDTLFHELVHATGHQKRLNRAEINDTSLLKKGAYSKEELTAEIGSAFLSAHTGIQTDKLLENNAAYLQGWLKALQNDKKFLFEAASKAQKATGYILNHKGE